MASFLSIDWMANPLFYQIDLSSRDAGAVLLAHNWAHFIKWNTSDLSGIASRRPSDQKSNIYSSVHHIFLKRRSMMFFLHPSLESMKPYIFENLALTINFTF